MSGIPPDRHQVLALLLGILTTYAPDIVLPLPDGVLSFTYRLVMELMRDCLTKYHQGRISQEYLEHLQQNIWTLVQQAEEKSQSGKLAFFKQLAQNVLLVLEYLAYSLKRLETSDGDSKEGQNLNIADPDTSESGLNSDLTEEITLLANADSGICETPEISHESASALIGSLNPERNPCKSDYKPIKLISSGAFGAVHLVRHKDTDQICAVKKIDKENLKNIKALELVFLERDISTFADCPFVASMFCSFPTKLHLCMVMEYVPGGDCGSLINHRGPLPLPLARLYIAETILAVEYLHSFGVVHRDLKPDNILITSTGHIKVTDFGLSKLGLMRPTSDIYKAPTKDITHEFLDGEAFGTPKYMAPEVILGKGYGRPVDWWSVGIILYNFFFAITPFRGASKREIVRSVLEDDIIWKHHNYSAPPYARRLITELLRKNPAYRLGTEGANEIKVHPFLRVLDFNKLLSQKPMFVPDLKSDEDTRYFIIGRSRQKHMNSDEGDTTEDNDWPEMKNFVSSYQRFSKLHITNTGIMTNVEPSSPPQCSKENHENHSDMQKESSPSKTIGDNEEPMSAQGLSSENSKKHSDMQKESSPSKTIGDNEEPMSAPGLSPENSKKHSDMQKELSSCNTNGDNQCFSAKTSESSSPSLSESPVQRNRKSFLKLRKQQKTEKVEEGERRRGSIFRRMISSCRRGLSRAVRAVRESCIFAPCQHGSYNISTTEIPHI
ncbi:microtubule-associated serine/threonine-protein kinase 4-like [Ranitomeya variabilis]|uniref:microtubule-associated serine/threonine-protein kinase 4-like n=1 Tax=Ranitomeya variabilis TaxID=490064 RepID=UPI0040560DF4